MSAKEAFKAYVRAYDSHHLKQIFDVHTLDLNAVAKSFGFTVPPAVDLSILLKKNIHTHTHTQVTHKYHTPSKSLEVPAHTKIISKL